jgi:hypothetical protein
MGLIADHLSDASFWMPDYLIDSAWIEHAPFAFWLTQQFQPQTFVELGAHRGYSYFSVCQAVKRLALNTKCYAVDTWAGDDHAGFYGNEVFDEVKAHHDPRYTKFSELMRMTFDEAVEHFQDGTVDLLHIDGRHFYEDVSHDFNTWKAKLSNRGVVLFHDTNVRNSTFGVYRFWEELKDQYPQFEFLHGHGLGVLGVGKDLPETICSLFAACGNESAERLIRDTYSRLGRSLLDRLLYLRHADENVELRAESLTKTGKLQRKVARLSQENETLKAVDKDSIAQISSLQAEVASHKAEHSRQTNSVSWKMTAPLRRLSPQKHVGANPVAVASQHESGAIEGSDLARDAKTIEQSGLFDAQWYLQQNRDILRAGVNPLEHYLRHGAWEGRNPNPLFDSQWYIEHSSGAVEPKVNPLVHYLTVGWEQGRDPHPLFAGNWYLQQNPDVAKSGQNPLVHYWSAGAKERRDPNVLFCTDWYIAQDPNLSTSDLNALVHYINEGAADGLDPHPLFDTDWYTNEYQVESNPLAHFLHQGASSGFNPGSLFDSKWYLQENATANGEDLSPFFHY